MKKWTTTGPNTCGVSLQQILDARSGPLNDIECWALIGQLCIEVQENICSYNVKTLRTSSSAHLPNFVVTPQTVRCTRIGRTLLMPYSNIATQGFEDIHTEYTMLHNLESSSEEYKHHMTKIGIRSIGKTILHCFTSNINKNQRAKSSESNSLPNFLSSLLLNYQHISTQEIQDKVSLIWAHDRKSAVGHCFF